MSANSNDEIDLGLIFRKIREGFRSLLVLGYQGVQFIFKYWIALLIIIIGGAVAGHYWQKSKKADKLATLIVQTNFDSTSYVYSALELLNRKNLQGDYAFMSEYGFNTETPELSDVVIEPIVNIMELMGKSETNDRNLEQYLAQSDFEEDILLSEVFFTEYKYHKIYIFTTSDGNQETIDKVLAYLNSNEVYLKAKDIVVEETKLRIVRNDTSISKIDAVFDEYVGKADPQQVAPIPSQIYFKTQTNNNLHQLITSKSELIQENEDLKRELIKYENVVSLLNKPVLHFTFSNWDRKTLLVPIALLFLFVSCFVLRGMYLKGKEYSEKQN